MPFTDAEELATLQDFYGWKAGALPLGEQLITRSQPGTAQPKRLYFVNAGAAQSFWLSVLPGGMFERLGSTLVVVLAVP